MGLSEIMDTLPEFKDEEILKSFIKGYSVINKRGYERPICSISGGSDSDIVLDIISRIDYDHKVKYVWFDTGLEYKATKEHLRYLEKHYNITIERERAIKPIPIVAREYGQPFLSKYVSQVIAMLQRNGFGFEDEKYEVLAEKYPKCKSAVKWWTNQYTKDNGFEKISRFDIGYNKYLKEFMVRNPPEFKISALCCEYSKKGVAKNIIKKYHGDLNITGIRRAEGGIRAGAYKSCYTTGEAIDSYRPVFWFTNETKHKYEQAFKIKHSDLYEKYGFFRTGCCACPYSNRNLKHELDTVRKTEQNLYNAVTNVFGDSYEYTRKYYEFYDKMKAQDKENKDLLEGQMNINEIIGE